MSRRERIIEILSSAREPLDVSQIAAALGLSASEAGAIYEDLEHIARSLRRSDKVLLMIPPACRSCGYVFRDLRRLRRPSKCPRCRGERISSPRFIIKHRNEL